MPSARDRIDEPRAVWDAVASGWDRHHEVLGEHSQPIARRLLELGNPQPDDVVLELAAGLGELSRSVAAQLGPDGRVIATDLSPQMVEIAERRTSDAQNLTFRVLDAQQMELPDASVDVVLCKMGLMLFDDPTAAMVGCRRVLRPGGRLAVATWGPADRNLWIATFGAAMLSHGHELPGDPMEPGGIFSLSEPETLHDLLASAGFEDITVETIDLVQRFATFSDYWEHVSETSGPLTVMLETLPPEEVDVIRTTCEGYAEHLRTDGGAYSFPSCALVAAAR